jgi:dTDP-glucose 4,6-dehydratase
MKLVVITGCLGFIGSHVTNKCLGSGWKVYGIDNETYAANPQLIRTFKGHYKKNFTYINEDIADLKYLPDCDYVINTAAETHVGNSIIDSTDFLRTNVDGVRNLLDLIKSKPNNVNKRPILFQFSTDEVYGDITEGEHTEHDLLNPSNPYSASKAAADMLVKAWSRTYGLEYVILRPTNNYGSYQYPEKLIPLAVKLLMRDKKIRLHDEGEPIRNWLHAEDTANAVISIINSGKVNETYNVAGSFEQQNKETVRKIIKAYCGTDENWEQYVDLGYKRLGQDVRYALDDSKLRSLGWKPEKVFNEEIEKVVKFYIDNFKW